MTEFVNPKGTISRWTPLKEGIKKTLIFYRWLIGEKDVFPIALLTLAQIFFALLDVLFLALMGPFVTGLSKGLALSTSVSILGLFSMTLTNLMLVIAGLVFLKDNLNIVLARFYFRLLAKREAEVAAAFVERQLLSPFNPGTSDHTADFLQFTNIAIVDIFRSILRPLLALCSDIFTLIAITVGFFLIETNLASILAIYLTLSLFVLYRYVTARNRDIGNEAIFYSRKIFRGQSEIRLLERELVMNFAEKPLLNNYYDEKSIWAGLQAKIALLQMMPRYILEMILIASVTGIVLYYSTTESSSALLESLGITVAAGYRILPSLNSILVAVGNFKNSKGSWNRAIEIATRLDFLGTPVHFSSNHVRVPRANASGNLKFKDMSYTYEGENYSIFHNFSLEIAPGSCTIVSGDSGSGKSTFLDLAMGHLKPTAGTICFEDGNTSFPVGSDVTGISYVRQNVALLDESIGYNIALREVSENDFPRLNQVSEIVGLKARIDTAPEGYETQVGEDGSFLSLGEKQRLSIARALFQDPHFLFLDEPTSALDIDNQNLIWACLGKLKEKMTIVVVTHDEYPSSLPDQIITLSKGNTPVVKAGNRE
jgi:ATP-binding cassette subfamily C protein